MARKQRIKEPKPEAQAHQWGTPKKRMKGEGVFYDEPKSESLRLVLTPASKARLKELAKLSKVSMCEYIERWLAGNTDGLILP